MRTLGLLAFRTCAALAAVAASAVPALAQGEPITAPLQSFVAELDTIDSGFVENLGTAPAAVFSTEVRVDGASWLRLQFDDVVLSGNVAGDDASYLLITSLKDGHYQYLNAQHVQQWRKTSAYFNGDAVRVELIAHPNTGKNRLAMSQATAGAPAEITESICDGVDDRALSSDPRSARILPIGCTGWLINDCNHCFLTAGHCAGGVDVIQFNVPLSNSNGSLNHPGPEDQYVTDATSLQDNGGQGVGNDWGYYGVFPNSTTSLTAFEAQGAAFELASMAPPVSGQNIRITGYGTTSSPVPNQWNQVQKTHAGPFATSSGTTVQYRTDTTGGNSGSPVIDDSTGLAIGIHTHGGCGNGTGANSGTAIQHPGLQAALASPQGLCAAAGMSFTFPNGLPAFLSPAGGTTIRVNVAGSGTNPQAGTGQLHYDVGSGYVVVPMSDAGAGSFDAVFPAADCETLVEFYFSVEGENGTRYYEPGGCQPPSAGMQLVAAAGVTTILVDDFEAASGWTAGAPGDDATTGVWNRMNPQATGAQPEDDHSDPGTVCWVTDGNAGTGIGSFDVDNGRTTLLSPVFDLSATPSARVSFWLWYSNTGGGAPNADIFEIDVNDGSGWVNAEIVGPDGPDTSGGWFYHEFRVSDVASPTSTVQFRFVASDLGTGSIVEAALDDFSILVVECGAAPCPGDLDGDRDIDLEDLSVLLANFGTGGATYEDGDLDGNGTVDLGDLSQILAVYGSTCP